MKKNPRAKRFMPVTASQQNCLLGMLNQIPDRSKPVGLSLFGDYSESFHHKAQVLQTPNIPPSLREFYNRKLSVEQKENQVKSVHEVKLSPEPIKFIEKSAVLQSNSIVWKSLRADRITASVHEVLYTNQNRHAKNLIKNYVQRIKT